MTRLSAKPKLRPDSTNHHFGTVGIVPHNALTLFFVAVHSSDASSRSEEKCEKKKKRKKWRHCHALHQNMSPQGPLVRLSGLSTAELPPLSASADELEPFLNTLLQQAVPFLDSIPTDAPSSALWRSKGTKTFPESEAPVDVTERVVALTVDGRSETETWACRRSVHVDAAQTGSASWDEFVECLRDRHAETEDAFTPTVLGHREVASWAHAREVGAISVSGSGSGSRWGRFWMAVVEMKHKIPPPLKPRVFNVLQVACTAQDDGDDGGAAGGPAFVVVSVPVKDLATGPWKDKAKLSLDSGVVIGAYAAVERVRRIRGEGAAAAQVEWIMATASDAKGVLPLWLQVKAVPGQVAKDVKLFLHWVDGERKKGTLRGVAAAA